mmetsp:Transcript_51118/g.101725  ORF Transcript_51118/g.101725 Transcript_51118/m.101725 type:complete len:88 (+) Transcript_51118:186-449(+)
MPSAQFAARIVKEYFPGARVQLERGAHNGKPLGSYNSNPEGKIYVQTLSGLPIAAVVQADVTEEQAPGPGLQELRDRLAAFAKGKTQ